MQGARVSSWMCSFNRCFLNTYSVAGPVLVTKEEQEKGLTFSCAAMNLEGQTDRQAPAKECDQVWDGGRIGCLSQDPITHPKGQGSFGSSWDLRSDQESGVSAILESKRVPGGKREMLTVSGTVPHQSG